MCAVADLPGLVCGAATKNIGLGAEFLGMVEACHLLAYVIDVGTPLSLARDGFSDGSADFESQLHTLSQELRAYDSSLVSSDRSCIIIGTKIDLALPNPVWTADHDAICARLTNAARKIDIQPTFVNLISARRGFFLEELLDNLHQSFENSSN